MLRTETEKIYRGIGEETNENNIPATLQEFKKKIEKEYKTALKKVEEIRKKKEKDPQACVEEELKEIYDIVSTGCGETRNTSETGNLEDIKKDVKHIYFVIRKVVKFIQNC